MTSVEVNTAERGSPGNLGWGVVQEHTLGAGAGGHAPEDEIGDPQGERPAGQRPGEPFGVGQDERSLQPGPGDQGAANGNGQPAMQEQDVDDQVDGVNRHTVGEGSGCSADLGFPLRPTDEEH
jgi:hypothetical protein